MTDTIAALSTALADRYRIEGEIGAGGMATVYLAHDVRHDRKVALKVLRPELAAILGGERFVHEIKTTANLQHPHILPLHDSGEVDGTVFFVMPYVEGESLRDRLAREKQLPVQEAVRIAREVADALDYAHRHDVIHRDIKPENILLHDGRALVADFGIALAASRSDGGGRMTETGMSLGTPHYMSPEQAMGERDITARVDVYALGCVLYEMLLGEPPFTGPTAQAVVAKVMTDEPGGLTIRRKSIPPHVEGAVLQALEKLPADRFASAAEFAGALEGKVATRPTTYATPASRAIVGPWRAIALVTSVVAVVSIAVALWAWRRDPPRDVTRVSVNLPEGLTTVATRRFAITPAGDRIVFVGPDTNGTQLWVRELNALTARPLPGTAGALAPFFSPDGESIAFFTGNPGDLRVVRVSGGPPQTVVRDSSTPFGGDWGADGMLYYSDHDSRIARVPASGGVAEQVSVLDTARGTTEHDWPQVLPGGRVALVQIWRTSVADTRIGLLDFRTGAARELLDGAYARYLPTGHLLYATFDGSLLVVPFDVGRQEITGTPRPVADGVAVDAFSGAAQFAVADNGTLLYLPGGGAGTEVVWVTRDGETTPVDSGWLGTFTSLALSPDDARLAISVTSSDGDHIWVKQLDAGPLTRLTFSGTSNYRPTWTPDGRQIAFISNRADQRNQAWIQRADGSAPADSLIATENTVDQIAWAPDGRSFALRTGSAGTRTRDILAMRPRGDSVPRTLVGGEFDEFAPDIAPGGRWFAYVSLESGRSEVFVRRYDDPGAGRTQVSVDGGSEPRWAHNGRELFFRSPRGDMMVSDVTLGSTFSASTPRVLFTASSFQIAPYDRAYDVTSDDRRFAMISTAAEATDMVMVVNWFEEIESPRR